MIPAGRGEAAASFVKLVATGAASSPFVDAMTKYMAVPVMSVTVGTVMAAFTGAGMSMFFGDSIGTRRMLAGQVFAATAFGVAVAVLAADGAGWEWAQRNMSMFALMSAAILRWFLPTLIDKGKSSIKDAKIPFTKKTPGDGQ